MRVFEKLGKLAEQTWAWGVLFASTLILEAAALYFQYAMHLEPCIMCIYQRTAVFGVLLAALIPLIKNTLFSRFIGFIGWGVSSVWGLLIAIEHVDLQNASNPFFAACEIVPNFPSFMPLHQWLPNIFAATGDCGSIDWQLLGMSMPQWMIVIFAIYAVSFGLILFSRLFTRRSF